MKRSARSQFHFSTILFTTISLLVYSLVGALASSSSVPSQPAPVINMDMTRERQPFSLLGLVQTSVMDPLEDTVASLLHPSSYHRRSEKNRRPTARVEKGAPTLTNTIWSYVISVGIGVPTQKFKIIFDTGSPLLWVPSKTCGDECLGAGNVYDIRQSKTAQLARENAIDVTYGSGSVSGDVVLDTLTFESKKVANQSIGLATKVAADILSGGVDGIIGFAPSRGTADFNTKNEILPTPMEMLVAQHIVAKNIFSVFFQPIRKPEDIGVVGGKLTLGGLPPAELYEGDIHWLKQIVDGDYANYWAIDMDHIVVGNVVIQPARQIYGIVDTGTTLIVVPSEMATKMYSNIPNALFNDPLQMWTVPCKDVQSLPSISFAFGPGGSTSFILSPSQYVVPEWETALWGTGDSGLCPTYVIGQTLENMDFIIGQKFLEHYVSVYDGDSHQVGFARAKPTRV